MSARGGATDDDEPAARLARAMAARGLDGADVAVVLGSGLGGLAERLSGAHAVGFDELEDAPRGTVPGHAGRFAIGALGGARVLVQQGRVHLYEGRTPEEVTRGARALARLGVRALVLTNAAGGVRPEWRPGTLMRIDDHVNLTGRVPPPAGAAGAGAVYDAALGAVLARAARDERVALERGVYAGFLGPAYETPAEIRMARWIGADAVGMSTVLEAVAAAARGVRVVGLACITNHAAGIGGAPLAHADVLAVGRAAAADLERVLARALPALAAARA